MAKGKSEHAVTKGGIVTPSAGMANDVTGNPPACGEYGPHKGVGEQPFPVSEGGSPRAPGGGVLIRKMVRGKKASA